MMYHCCSLVRYDVHNNKILMFSHQICVFKVILMSYGKQNRTFVIRAPVILNVFFDAKKKDEMQGKPSIFTLTP